MIARIATPEDVLGFWFPAGHDADAETLRSHAERWFQGGQPVDDEIRARFGATHDAAADGGLDRWADTPRGRLALVIVLDQFSRNLFRGTARAFAYDAKARALATGGFDRGEANALSAAERMFLRLPFAHSENLADQDRSVAELERILATLPARLAPMAEHLRARATARRDAVRRFGRIPERNQALGRESTPEELAYLRSSACGPIPRSFGASPARLSPAAHP